MKSKLILLAILFLQTIIITAQKNLLQSGPMIGYSEMKEVMLWVQTNKKSEVYILYYSKSQPEIKHRTNTVITSKDKAYTAHLLADELEPGQVYNYDLYINNKIVKFDYKTSFQTLPLWQWRTDPPEINFVTGSGAYINEEKYDRPGKGYGSNYQIYENIADKNPDFMIWLGDNVYLREADWNTKTGIFHRYTHSRSINEMQRLLATVHQYAIWDDHDFGPNNSDKGFWNKNMTLEAFKLFWANPSYGVGNIKGAISYFNWGDCDFFLLDNRYYRDPNRLKTDNKTILGEKQLEWLKDALVYSNANFKFVVMGGQFLTTAGLFEVYSNYGFSDERNEIIEFIHKHEIRNVIFLTGDRHHSEISILDRAEKPVIYDITTSPFTSGVATKWENEINQLRVKGSLINDHNFSVFNITGKRKDRILTVTFYDKEGNKIFDYQIKNEKKEDRKLKKLD
ncbi:MAG: alkaline phosphatase family protein [Bacteroidales bacterium]|nr:alkaline phosphatase family protein [Bacteroidales bacterium]